MHVYLLIDRGHEQPACNSAAKQQNAFMQHACRHSCSVAGPTCIDSGPSSRNSSNLKSEDHGRVLMEPAVGSLQRQLFELNI